MRRYKMECEGEIRKQKYGGRLTHKTYGTVAFWLWGLGAGQGLWLISPSRSSQMAFSLCWVHGSTESLHFSGCDIIFWKLITEKEDKNGPVFLPSSNYNFDIIIKHCMVTFAVCCTKTFIISLSNAVLPTHKATHTLSLMIGSTFFFFLNNIYYLFSLVSFYGVYIIFYIDRCCNDMFRYFLDQPVNSLRRRSRHAIHAFPSMASNRYWVNVPSSLNNFIWINYLEPSFCLP